METIQIIVEGVSEEQIQKDIERMTKGWRLFFVEPSGVDYHFIQPFWGYPWDQTSENLKDTIIKAIEVNGRHKQHICIFKYDGEDRFAWCSWTKEVYDFNTGVKHQLEGNHLADKITELIIDLVEEDFLRYQDECLEALSSIGDKDFI